jgi:hypothetical protein
VTEPRLDYGCAKLNHPSGSVTFLSGSVILIAVFLELGFLGLCVAWGSAEQRRSHFGLRLLVASLVVPSLMAVLVAVARLDPLSHTAAKTVLPVLFLLGVMSLMLVPPRLYRGSGSPPGRPGSDGGGGPGPDPPRPTPVGPRGGIPLPDAAQARSRRRDHDAPRLVDYAPRRPAHQPGRGPARTPR